MLLSLPSIRGRTHPPACGHPGTRVDRPQGPPDRRAEAKPPQKETACVPVTPRR